MPEAKDIPAILRYYKENEVRLARTSPPKQEGFYTDPYWLGRIEIAQRSWELEQGLTLFVFKSGEESGAPEVIGYIGFSQMFRGPFQACYLGYDIDAGHEGKGMMTEALGAAIGYLFRELNFHRIMANHLPDNERSARLLGRLGFEVEGRARDYLFINGQWRDHVLTSLTNREWKGPGA